MSKMNKGLQDLLNENPVATPQQLVQPIIIKEKEVPFTFYLPEKKLNELKLKALNEKTSSKKIIIKGIDMILGK